MNTNYTTMTDQELNRISADVMGWPTASFRGANYHADSYPAYMTFMAPDGIYVVRSPALRERWPPATDANQALELAEHVRGEGWRLLRFP